MKKAYFLASMLAVGALCSCSNDTEVTANMPQTEEDAMQPVTLSLGSPSISVRGTGTVGGIQDAPENVWAGETLHLVMMNMDDADWAPTTWGYSDAEVSDPLTDIEDVVNFNHLQVTAPTGATGDITWEKSAGSDNVKQDLKFYPQDGSTHKFFAYRIDDAAATYTQGVGQTGMDADGTWAADANYTTNKYPTVYTEDGKAFFTDMTTGEKSADANGKQTQYVYFTIDGTQDLMAGMADNTDAGYSSKTARAGVKPSISMNHLLTRLTFSVTGGSESAKNLEVYKVEVTSKCDGRMCVAYADAAPGSLIEFADKTATFELKERAGANQTMTDLTSTAITNTDGATFQTIGDAIMVAPGETAYELKVYVKENLDGDKGTSYGDNYGEPLVGTIKLTGDAPLQAGTSYEVKMTLYGSEAISVAVELTGWTEGEEIPVFGDDDVEP